VQTTHHPGYVGGLPRDVHHKHTIHTRGNIIARFRNSCVDVASMLTNIYYPIYCIVLACEDVQTADAV